MQPTSPETLPTLTQEQVLDLRRRVTEGEIPSMAELQAAINYLRIARSAAPKAKEPKAPKAGAKPKASLDDVMNMLKGQL